MAPRLDPLVRQWPPRPRGEKGPRRSDSKPEAENIRLHLERDRGRPGRLAWSFLLSGTSPCGGLRICCVHPHGGELPVSNVDCVQAGCGGAQMIKASVVDMLPFAAQGQIPLPMDVDV